MRSTFEPSAPLKRQSGRRARRSPPGLSLGPVEEDHRTDGMPMERRGEGIIHPAVQLIGPAVTDNDVLDRLKMKD